MRKIWKLTIETHDKDDDVKFDLIDLIESISCSELKTFSIERIK